MSSKHSPVDKTNFRDRFGLDVRELYGINVEPTPMLLKNGIKEWIRKDKTNRLIPIKPSAKPVEHKLRRVKEISITVLGETLESQTKLVSDWTKPELTPEEIIEWNRVVHEGYGGYCL